ncbi:small basic family protein [Thermosediminibacter litoriperuensis]|uniref:Small basic protein n=1 Tax=Thermosediminibacter litoriperuensis TaxID=291989 RepID=A0A5S5ASD4_9FIRM|nr:small basic family protein [Thermosediminibacter litoriperuensis]TYP54937.1 small basic protein [Thermosediminibacter litoriperuensis]
MLFPLIGLILGILAGLVFPINIPLSYAPYASIAVLAALDSVFGGLRAMGEGHFNVNIFITGFFSNALLAGFLAFLGDKLGIPIYMAAIFAFGVRIFQNLAIIRRHMLDRLFKRN